MTTYDAIILGAGGAGLMCAATAGQRGRRVLVIDHADKPGKKILISGGGRCNFTNVFTAPDRFLSANPHFAKSALRRYTPADFIALVEAHNIAWHEKTLGQLFCDGSARQIVAMLLAECDKGDVTIALDQAITNVDKADGLFRVTTDKQQAVAPSLVIATGGPSIPKMGATGFAYDLARRFGLEIVEPRPALVPFTLDQAKSPFNGLTGVATEIIARRGKRAFREAGLFTHKGMSGPAILQISSYWTPGDNIAIDFLPSAPADWLQEQKRNRPRTTLRTILATELPDRLAAVFAEATGCTGEIGNLSDKKLRDVRAALSNWVITPSGTEGFAKAEVTVGGIDTNALSSRTMEAKTTPGLYAIGEAVDVTGWLGGYNFQWAWASGVAAGEAI